jgi:hypothetical protein
MKTKINITAIVLLALFFVSCGKDLSNLKVIQEQSTENFRVSVLSGDGTIKQGSGLFVVEFRNTSNNELVKVDNIRANAVMQMAGMPMTGETALTDTDTPGRYEVKYNFSDKGNWKFIIFFGKGLQVQFSLSVI